MPCGESFVGFCVNLVVNGSITGAIDICPLKKKKKGAPKKDEKESKGEAASESPADEMAEIKKRMHSETT